MNIEEDLFKKSIINYEKLIAYGFKLKENNYIYEENILNKRFKVIVTIFPHNIIKGQIIDLKTNEEYTNFRLTNEIGSFNSQIKEIFIDILVNIKNNCTLKNLFNFKQTNRLANLILKKYHIKPEFPWDSLDAAVFRHSSNQKWFALIMNVSKDKIGEGKENVEILNLKIDEKIIPQLLKQKGYYQAYHMNKKKWLTIILDDTLSDSEIMANIDISYQLTDSKKMSTK